MSAARDNLWQSQFADESFIQDYENDSELLTSLREPSQCAAAERLVREDTTVVTNDNDDDDSEEYYSAPEEEEDEGEDDEEDEYSEMKILTDGVPAEVKVSFHENDNDDSSCDEGSDPESDCESEEETDDATEESEQEDNDDEDFDSADEYETDEDALDEDSVQSERSEDFEFTDDPSGIDGRLPHELFLPRNVSPCTESLKYNEDEDEEEDSSDEEDEPPAIYYRRRAYMTGNNRNSGRPRMWDGCPSGVSVSSDSSSSSEGSYSSRGSPHKKRKASPKTGVSFSDSVTVYPVFETRAYPSSVVESIYTGREELRANKLRNKREFAYDRHDWRNATEEEEMETDGDGKLMHPAHHAEKKPCRTRNVVQTYSSALGGYTVGSVSGNGAVHRAKRMRMYYP